MITWRTLVPASVKKVMKDQYRMRVLSNAVHRISASPNRAPDNVVLADLIRGWGNEGYSATTDYLEEISRMALKTAGSVLECGSGISTILLNLLCAPRKVPVWSLEHFPVWQAHVRQSLMRFGLDPLLVTLAPLRNFGGYTWYDAPLAEMPRDISLVVCDGPPGDTPGGRYGLLPRCINHLVKGAVILLDDADRPQEQAALERWTKEFNVTVEMKRSPTHCYAIASLPA